MQIKENGASAFTRLRRMPRAEARGIFTADGLNQRQKGVFPEVSTPDILIFFLPPPIFGASPCTSPSPPLFHSPNA